MDKDFNNWFLESFTLKSPSKRNRKTDKGARKPEKINTEVLSSQRRQNMSIPLRKLGITHAELVSAIECVDEKVLTEDTLERIISMLPNEKEMKGIRNVLMLLFRRHCRRSNVVGDIIENEEIVSKLPDEEALMIKLSRIPRARKRLDLLLFTHHFSADCKRAAGLLEIVEDGVQKINFAANSGHLRRLLKNVLHFINILNEEKMKGYRISTLSKLSRTKMTKGSGSLLDVIVMHATTIDKEKCANVEEELAGLEEACSIDFGEIKALVQGISGRMEEFKKFINDSGDGDGDGKLRGKVKSFYDEHVGKFKALQKKTETVWVTYDALRLSFHEPEMKMQDFFKAFFNFHMEFTSCRQKFEEKRIRAEHQKKRADTKKKLKEAKERRRLTRSFSLPAGASIEMISDSDCDESSPGKLMLHGEEEIPFGSGSRVAKARKKRNLIVKKSSLRRSSLAHAKSEHSLNLTPGKRQSCGKASGSGFKDLPDLISSTSGSEKLESKEREKIKKRSRSARRSSVRTAGGNMVKDIQYQDENRQNNHVPGEYVATILNVRGFEEEYKYAPDPEPRETPAGQKKMPVVSDEATEDEVVQIMSQMGGSNSNIMNKIHTFDAFVKDRFEHS